MTNLDATLQVKRTRAIWSLIALANLGGLDGTVSGKITPHRQPVHVLSGSICASDPRGSINHARINQEANTSHRITILIEVASRRIRSCGHGADVAGNQLGVLCQIFRTGHFDFRWCDRSLKTLHIDIAVTGHTQENDLTLTVRMRKRDNEALQCIRGLPRAIIAGVKLIGALNQGLDSRGIGSFAHLEFGNAIERKRLGSRRHHGLGIGSVASRRTHESILANRAGVKEFLGTRATHGTRHRGNNHVLQAQTLKDALVGIALILVGNIQTSIINIEGICILHDELTAADQTCARTGFITILRLDLVNRQRQVLVRGVLILHQEGEHLLVGRSQEIVPALTVLQLEQSRTIFIPAIGRLVRLCRKKRRKVNFLSADTVHLFTNNCLYLAQQTQAKRKPRVDTGGSTTNVARTDKELMGNNFGISRIFAQSAQEERGKSS